MEDRGAAHPGTNTLSAILVYGGAIVVLCALVWSLSVAGRMPWSSAEVTLPVAVESVVPIGPPSDAVWISALGAARDAARLRGVWYILDRSGARVHRLDETGAYLGSFAGEGNGPGELRRPRAITVHADTVVVAEWRSISLYASDGTGLARRRIETPPGCSSVADVASSSAGLLLLLRCYSGEEYKSIVVREGGEDGLQLLAASIAGPQDEEMLTAFRDMAVLSAHPRGFVFGHPNDDCMEVLDLDGQVADTVCHDWIRRAPYTVAGGEDWDALHAAARTIGMTVEVPEFYPPFDRVFVGDDGGLVYRTPMSGQMDVSRLVRNEAEQEPGFAIPPAHATFLEDTSILAVWYERDRTWVKIYDMVSG